MGFTLHRTSEQLARRFRKEWLWLLVVWLGVGALLIVLLWTNRNQVIKQESSVLEQGARMLQETLAVQLEASNRSLEVFIADWQRWQGQEDRLERANRRLEALPGAVIGVGSMAMLDASGIVLAASDRDLLGQNLSDRAYYIAARPQVANQSISLNTLIVTPPYQAADGSWVMALARRVLMSDGQFDGVVAATLDPAQVLTLLQPALYSPDTLVSLLHADGIRFLAMIGNNRILQASGVDVTQAGSLFMRHRESGLDSNLLLGVRFPGDVPRLMALRNIQPPALQMDKALVIAVGQDWRSILVDWQHEVLFWSLIYPLAGLFAVLILRHFQRRHRQIQLQEDELAAQSAAMDARWRAVLEATNQGVWDWNAVTNKVYFSPVWKSMLGYTEEEVGDDLGEWGDRLHPEDRDSTLADVKRHLDGETPFYESVHRVATKGGGYKWILDRGRVIERDSSGKALRVIGTHTDVTESRRQRERLDRLAENLPGALFQYLKTADGHSSFPYASKGIEAVYGYEPQDLKDDATAVFQRIHPDDLPGVKDSIEQSARSLDVWSVEYRVILPDLGERWLSGLAKPQAIEAGAVLWHGYIHDITKTKQQALKLQETERLLQHLLNEMPIGLCMVDVDGHIYYRNRRFEMLLGYTYEEAPTQEKLWSKAYPDPYMRARVTTEWTDAVAHAAATGEDIPASDHKVIARDGTERTVSIGGILFGNRILATFVDNTERQALHDALHKLAYRDGLTGVSNRRHFDQVLQSEWQRCRRSQRPLALLMIDIDHFKLYNDTYGHQQGDICLQSVASALQSAFKRSHDLVARYGGEEFICLMPDCDLDGARSQAQVLCQVIQDLGLPHISSLTSSVVTISIGVACQIPDEHSTPEMLVTTADDNLYRAKKKGRNRFDDGTGEPS